MGIICSPGSDPNKKIWDRHRKIKREIFRRERKPTGYIYLPKSKYREDECYLNLRSCLQDDVFNSSPRIGKYINTLELYIQCPTKIVKYTKIT